MKSIADIEFIHCVDFDLIDNKPADGTKYLLLFHDSLDILSKSEKFNAIATTCRHRNLYCLYIKHNLFHFIRFFFECIVNLMEGNLTGLRINQVARFQKQLRKLTSKSITLSSRRLILGSKIGITILSYIYHPIMNNLATFFDEWGQKVCYCSKSTVGDQKRNYLNRTARSMKKKKQFSQPSKKRKKKLVLKKSTVHLKSLRKTWTFTVWKILRHWKFSEKYTKTNRWMCFLIQKFLTFRPHLVNNNILRTRYGSERFNYLFRENQIAESV